MSSSIVQKMVWCNICDRKNDFVLCLISFHFHPSLSKRSGSSKGFDAGVTRGPDVEGGPTMASRRCSSRSLIFLIASKPRRVALKPDIRGQLGSSLVLRFIKKEGRVVQVCLHSLSPPAPEKLHLLHVGE